MAKMVVSREQVGKYDVYGYNDGEFGLANDNRVCYFSTREDAVNYALKYRAMDLWVQNLHEGGAAFDEFDIGACQIILYADNVIGVFHAGDDRTFTVSKFFDTIAAAEAYARRVNQDRVH